VQRSPVDVLNGLRELRAAALLQIAASILVGISGFMQLPFPFNFEPLAVGLSRSVFLVVAMMLAIISVYFYLLPSAEQFSLQKPEEFSTPSKLMRAGYLGGATLILLSNLIIIVGVTTTGGSGSLGTNLAILGSLALAITGGIMLLAGLVGIIIILPQAQRHVQLNAISSNSDFAGSIRTYTSRLHGMDSRICRGKLAGKEDLNEIALILFFTLFLNILNKLSGFLCKSP